MSRFPRLRAWALAQFRPAAERGPAWNVAKTFGHMVVFWLVFFFLVPRGFHALEAYFGVAAFRFATQAWLPWLGFVAAGSLGLWSGYTMASLGAGTPLPVDCPRRLVVAGPYRFIRNPMAVAGLAQGACVGLAWGSPSATLYVVLGGFIWNTFVRPLEEADLVARFGDDFSHYQTSVRCWIPRFSAYDPKASDA